MPHKYVKAHCTECNQVTKHICTKHTKGLKEQTMTERKELIDPSEYKNIKVGDNLEIVINTTFDEHSSIKEEGVSISLTGAHIAEGHNCVGHNCVGIRKSALKAIYRILPAATKLEVGEILTKYKIFKSSGWKVLHIEYSKKRLTLLNIDNDCVFVTGTKCMKTFEVYSSPQEFERKSGIPIDWDATFND